MQTCRKIKVSSLIAPAWGVQWIPPSQRTIRVRQVARLATSLGGGRGHFSTIFSPHIIQAAASFATSARCNLHELSSAGWCSKPQQHKKARHNESVEVSWRPNLCKPAWMDPGVSTASPWGLSWDHEDQLISPGFGNCSLPEFVKKLCQHGQVKEAVEALEVSVEKNSGIDNHLLYFVLKECMEKKDLILGSKVHALAMKTGFGSDTFLCNHFIRMYAGHGKLQEAMDVFTGVALPDAFMCSSIITAHVKQGQAQRAIQLYQHMSTSRLKPDSHVLVAALQACAAARDLQSGKQVYQDALTSGMECDMFVCSSSVDMFAKCGSLPDARRVFDGLWDKNVVTWNAMMSGYARAQGMGQEALRLYGVMRNQGTAAPNAVTYVCLLQACANVGVSALQTGKQLHLQLIDLKLDCDVVVACSLLNMYAKCGSLKDARIIFDGLGERNIVTWTAMITGYAQQEGMGQEALHLYCKMHSEGMAVPDAVTFVCLLQACANVGFSALQIGKQLHLQLKHRGFESDVVVAGSLVNMYVKCGSIQDARIVFDGLGEKDVVTWSAMISGYAKQEGMGQEALDIYSAMRSQGMATPNVVTYVCLLQACANVGASALETGKLLHSQLNQQKLEYNEAVGGSLVNMYVKCGSLKDARIVFESLSEKNVVTWTAMIAGYAQVEGMGQEALNMYSVMCKEGMVAPNAVTYVCLLDACASVGALQQGKQLHSEIRERGFESDVLVGNCLVKMYANCGRLDVSREVFDRLTVKDLVTWNALLKGYAEYGDGDMAAQFFEELLRLGIQPNEVTYTSLFTACSHAGLVNQGQQHFEAMMERHGIQPNEWHYNCMVDLLGRSGHLDKAEQMLRASGLAGDTVSWTALLSACKSYGDVGLGRRCFEQLVKLEPTAATAYVLLGSIYANVGKWDEVGRLESMRKAAGARKMPGKACIEVKREVHEFTVGEERSDVAATLRKMNTRVREGGHVPQTQLVLRAVSDLEKEDALCGHAEKLALAYGLLNTPAGSTLVVTKNLRMCDDCHSSTKIMSRLEKREIVVRDGHKVHRFQQGVCSCQDRL